jgi:RNA polymerase sigma-70 factor (ECF subfamily)
MSAVRSTGTVLTFQAPARRSATGARDERERAEAPVAVDGSGAAGTSLLVDGSGAAGTSLLVDWPSVIGAARTGDARALRTVYDASVDAVYLRTLRLLRDRDTTLDVVQDAYERAFARLDQLSEPAAFSAWVATIAVRFAHDYLRRRRVMAFFHLDDAIPQVAWHEIAGDHGGARSDLERIDRELRTLPVAHRTAWILRRVEEAPLDEVAEACGCSVATVKRWLGAVDARIEEIFQ